MRWFKSDAEREVAAKNFSHYRKARADLADYRPELYDVVGRLPAGVRVTGWLIPPSTGSSDDRPRPAAGCRHQDRDLFSRTDREREAAHTAVILDCCAGSDDRVAPMLSPMRWLIRTTRGR